VYFFGVFIRCKLNKVIFVSFGITYISLDNKGRLAIPAKARDYLCVALGSTQLVVTLESPTHLLIYPEPNWRQVEAKLLALPTANPLLKKYQRLVLGCAETVEMDVTTGRILLPAALRSLMDFKKELALSWVGNRFELWDAATWRAETLSSLAIDPADLSDCLGDFSL
jgi:MraZ protein